VTVRRMFGRVCLCKNSVGAITEGTMTTNWKLMIKGLLIFLCFLSVEMYVPCSLMALVGDNMSLSADPSSIQADGLSTTKITAIVNYNGVSLFGVTLTFTITSEGAGAKFQTGTKTITTYSDKAGASTVVLYSDTTPGPATITCVASGTGSYMDTSTPPVPINMLFDVTRSVDVYFTGTDSTNSITLSAAPTSVTADNITPSIITATLLDQFGDKITKPGIPVVFATPAGLAHFSNNQITITASTDATGTATALLFSAVPGKASISATTNSVTSNTVFVTFTGGATPGSIVLTATPTSVDVVKLEPSTITAMLYDQYGVQIVKPGILVTFNVTGAGHFSDATTPQQINASTDATGTAIALLYSVVAGTADVSAVSGAVPSNHVYVIFTRPIIVLSAAPLSVLADNISFSTITASIYDQNGIQIKIPGISVVFTTTVAHFVNGPTSTTITVSTDTSGTAVALLYSVVAGTADVSASTYGITCNSIFVIFTATTVLSVNPTNRDVAKDIGTTTFSVSNTGTGTMPWTAAVTSGDSWLSVTSGASGSNSGTITCKFIENTSTTARKGTIQVTATGAASSPQDVTVTQAGQPVLSVSPASRDVAKDTGTATFGVSNTGTGTMPWTAAVTSGGSWLSITSGASGSNSGMITCKFIDNTTTAARMGTIQVTATGATGSPQNVTLTQAGPPVLSVSPASRDVAKDTGTATFGISNIGTGTMPWTAAVTSGGSWLAISGTSGTDTGTITCSFTANTSSSARTATIRVTAAGATGSPKDVTVTQAGSTQPVLSVSPASRDVVKGAGTTTLSVSNTGTGTMSWTAQVTSGSSWLRIQSGASGSDTGTITYAFDANAGTSARKGIILVTAVGATGSPKDVTVTQAGSLSGSLAASFDSLGLWVYNLDSATWTQIHSANPENMICSGSTLYADFGASYGLWMWDGAAWAQITTANPENMVFSGSMLYVGFGATYGLWRWDGAALVQLTSANPEKMVASGSMLYVDFGATYGLWRWDGAAWAQLTTANPENMVISGSTLYVGFGATYGLWRWDGTVWRQLTPANPENMVTSGSTIYADFGVPGLWRWDGASWSQLTSANPENIVTSGSGSVLYADFGAYYARPPYIIPSYGLCKWDGAVWSQLTSANPENMVASGSALYVDFGALGLYIWNDTAWSQLTGSNPMIMAIFN
jgi:Viral BACON domain/Invasin, domain 3